MEKQRRILFCFPSFILVSVCLFAMLLFGLVFNFLLGDAAGVKEGYGKTGKGEELGCMK